MEPSVDLSSANTVFLNIPYDRKFKSLYIAYVTGLVSLGLMPHVTLGLPGGTARLDKIMDLISGCRYSIHDLSRIELDRAQPFSTPRFNMPFELGLAVARTKLLKTEHEWFAFEAKNRRLQKSMSDLNGTDPQIHNGSVPGVMRELGNIFRRSDGQPTVPEMLQIYKAIVRRTPMIMQEVGAEDLFEAGAFRALCYEARIASENLPRFRPL